MSSSTSAPADGLDARIAVVVKAAAEHAADVDAQARFPVEAFQALKDTKLLGAPIPREFGGEDMLLRDMCKVARALGAQCSSAGLSYAMHISQVLCFARHGQHTTELATQNFDELMTKIAAEQLIVASATTEKGVGGNTRESLCHIDPQDDGTTVLYKDTPIISYGEYADVILVTARKHKDASATDQVIVAVEKSEYTLERTSQWTMMGFRGTESHGFIFRATAPSTHVFQQSFAEISGETMLPAVHLLWASAWLGIADGIVTKARKAVQKNARRQVGQDSPASLRLAELFITWQKLADLVESGHSRFETAEATEDGKESSSFTLTMNNIKITGSSLLADIAVEALRIIGISGYSQIGPNSIDRPLRDAMGAALMVNNDRILANNAQLGQIQRGLL